MATPASFTGYLNPGKFVMRQDLSGNSDPILAAQGVGFLKRKTIGIATVTIVNSSREENGVTIIKSASSASGIPGAVEELYLGAGPKKSDHSVYGKIITDASPKKPEEIEEKYLTEGLLPESQDADGKILYVYSTSDKAAGNKYEWTGIVTSGFQNVVVNGKSEKRWVRLNYFKDNKGFESKIRLVYDYAGAA